MFQTRELKSAGQWAHQESTMFWNSIADTYSNYGFKHLGLFLLLIVYSVIGGFGFRALESGYEMDQLTNAFLNSMLAKRDLKAQIQVRFCCHTVRYFILLFFRRLYSTVLCLMT
jgi:hypothetical protein